MPFFFLTGRAKSAIVRLSKTREESPMGRTTKTLTVSLPPQIFAEIERLAKVERKTRSELFRDMVKVYEDHLDEERWKRMKRLGEETAKKYRLTSEEVIEKLIHEARGTRN
jgi:CopG family transcriptional regulator/antitoxin EndoAI